MPTDQEAMRQPLARYATALHLFTSSPSKFRILHSLASTTLPPPKILYILDSSFNPPTVAHLHLITSALKNAQSQESMRVILLLAIQNADKPAQPASFEHRLTMMELFAANLRRETQELGVDIAVTKLPYFMDKAAAIDESGEYTPSAEKVHLTGYDTLIRFLDPKYYPPSHSLKVLEPFFENNRLRVSYRSFLDDPEEREKGKTDQDAYLSALRDGDRNKEGGNPGWVKNGRIEMCEGREGEVVSSTRVRQAVRVGNTRELQELMPESISKWIIDNKLYLDN